MKSKYLAEENFQIVMETFFENVAQDEICPSDDRYSLRLGEWMEQFMLRGKSALAQGRNSGLRNVEFQDLKKNVGDQSLVIDTFEKKASWELKMMVLEELRDQIPLREISRITGISLSEYYYKPVKRHIQRLDPSIKERIKYIASERPTFGYWRTWATLRNHRMYVDRKTVGNIINDGNLKIPVSKNIGRKEIKHLLKLTWHYQLWQTEITYIPTESVMTCLMSIKDTFTKECQEYYNFILCITGDAMRSMEIAVLLAFNETVPEGLVLSIDNCSQYISKEFKNALKLLGIKLEYIQKHTPEDDGDIGSPYNSIKTGYIWPDEFMSKFLNTSEFRERSWKSEGEVKLYEN